VHYAQHGNSCAAHTLVVISYLSDKFVVSQPTDVNWHADVDEYVWPKIRYTQADVNAVNDAHAKLAVQAWLGANTSSPFKLASLAETLKFGAEVCVGQTARNAAQLNPALAVGLKAVDELATAAGRAIAVKDGIAEVIARAPGTRYASIVTMFANGGFHNVTVRKEPGGGLEVHDSNDDQFIRWMACTIDPANPLTWHFSTHACPQTYTGLSVLLTPAQPAEDHFIKLEVERIAAVAKAEVEAMSQRIHLEVEEIARLAKIEVERISREAAAWVEKIAKESAERWGK
jgi:hypothetical protein